MTNKIVVVGSINADLMIRVDRHPLPGETLHGQGGNIAPGGKGANQAVAAAALGADVAMIGAVGQDANAAPALQFLKESGVDLAGVREVDEVTGLAVVAVDNAGENNIIVISGANAHMTSGLVEESADLIGAASIVVLQGEIPRTGFETAARLAQHRLIINLAPVVEVDRDALLKADPLIVNEHEGVLVLAQLGAPIAESSSPFDIVTALRAQGFASVVITLGARGALVSHDDAMVEVPSPRVHAVDTTGAGDAFVGGLAYRLAAGDSLEEAARFAVRVGAFACTGHGAQTSYAHSVEQLPEVQEV
ncbi:ribokinase [Arcanobacterium pluranimalium]|uniref:PfkB family carbohydrate kinase n=1 Tax=Arcanobacterium pluranimalium TaxID=108028 RepID=UPI0019593779|nr:ribokinase [Arcanobacterium pluranimalium]